MQVTVCRRSTEYPRGRIWVTWAEILFLSFGLFLLGFAAFFYFQAAVYQTYEKLAF